MRLVFAGTPEFAVISLRQLLRRGHQVALVLTQPDRPAGRGLQQVTSAVKKVAEEAGLDVAQPASLKDPLLQQRLAGLSTDVWVVAAYGLILPRAILASPRLGCVNVHASLLPRWRGAAPIQRAILAGDRETGVSIMRMEEGLDTGPVYLRRGIPIEPGETAGSLHDRLALLGADMLCEVLDAMAQGPLSAVDQSDEGVCYAAKLTREDALVDWVQPAIGVDRKIRAFYPAPGAYTQIRGQNIKLWRVVLRQCNSDQPPGTVLDVGPAGIQVQCANDSVVLTELQRPGGRRLSAVEFIRGFRIQRGDRFGA
jgi:methionyl-tRNA formyltransferase